jgi:hypothetical protein
VQCACTEVKYESLWISIMLVLDWSVLYESVESRFEPGMTCRHAAWKTRRVLFCWQLSLVHVCSFLSHIRLQIAFFIATFISKCLLIIILNWMRYISQYASYGIVQIHTLKYKHLQVKRLTRRETDKRSATYIASKSLASELSNELLNRETVRCCIFST